jgi:hypothetical protein
MRKSEIERRLSEMSIPLQQQVAQMIRDGYGALGISQNSPATLKQANAMFAAMAADRKHPAIEALEHAKSVLNSARVSRSADGSTIFIPLPRTLWRDRIFSTPCTCGKCDGDGLGDTLAVSVKPKDRDFTWIVHHPATREGR